MTIARGFGLLMLLWAAGAQADALSADLVGRKLLGQGDPELKISVHERITAFELTLKRSDGAVVKKRGGGKPGSVQTIRLPQPAGAFQYEGKLVAFFPQGAPTELPLTFETEVAGPPKISYRDEDLDLDNRTFRFQLSRPAGHAQVVVQMDTGATAFEGDVRFSGESAGTPLEIQWPETEGKVLRISLVAYDTSEFFSGLELFPWRVEIPHEEVHFASGKADLAASEQPKLQSSLEQIAAEIAKYGKWAPLKLYVLGHTDTVGGAAENRALSARRARAIATWFRKQGLKLPIFVEGFGEEALLVSTPDETDEAGNRRAEYIIAVGEPPMPGAPFPPKWKKL